MYTSLIAFAIKNSVRLPNPFAARLPILSKRDNKHEGWREISRRQCCHLVGCISIRGIFWSTRDKVIFGSFRGIIYLYIQLINIAFANATTLASLLVWWSPSCEEWIYDTQSNSVDTVKLELPVVCLHGVTQTTEQKDFLTVVYDKNRKE